MPNLIHLGLPKSGSTFLQEIFKLSSNCNMIPYHIARQKTISISRNFNAESNNIDNIENCIFSYEGISSFEHVSMSEALSAFLGDSIVLFVTREPVKFINSLYSTAVEHGAVSTIDEWMIDQANRLRNYLNFKGIYHAYSEIFGVENVVFIPFEVLIKTPSDVISLLNSRNIDLTDVDSNSIYKNPSPSNIEIEYIRKINKYISTSTSERILDPGFKKDLFRLRRKVISTLIKGRTELENREIHKNFIKSYQESNVTISQIRKAVPDIEEQVVFVNNLLKNSALAHEYTLS